MKKNKILAAIILIAGIIMVGAAIFLLVSKPEEKPVKPKGNEDIYGTDIEKDLTAKAMIYVANNNNYTTENYLIEVEQKDNNYIVTVKSKDNQLIENITIDEKTLQEWKPDNTSPEEMVPVDEPDNGISASDK